MNITEMAKYTDYNDIVNNISSKENDEIYNFCEAMTTRKGNNFFDVLDLNSRIIITSRISSDEYIVTDKTDPIIMDLFGKNIFDGIDYDSWYSFCRKISEE